MTEQMALQNTLRNHFLQLQKKNSAFSLRAFAVKLKISPSALSEILNGKRKVSKDLARRILTDLGLDPREKEKVLSLFQKSSEEPSGHLELRSDQFQIISKWHHFAILSLAETKGFRGDALWIAKRLGIKLLEAEQALQRLERLGLIRWHRLQKKVQLLHSQLSTSEDIASDAIRQSHYEDLSLAGRALDQVAVEKRDFSSITIAVDPAKLREAKKMIRDFQDHLSAFLSSGEPSEVYKFNFHVLPLSQEVL